MTVARSVDDVERLTHDPTVGAGAFTAPAAPAAPPSWAPSASPPCRSTPLAPRRCSPRGAPAATG